VLVPPVPREDLVRQAEFLHLREQISTEVGVKLCKGLMMAEENDFAMSGASHDVAEPNHLRIVQHALELSVLVTAGRSRDSIR